MNFINRIDDSLFVYGEKIILYEGNQKKKKRLLFCILNFLCIFAPQNGALAHLARALDWQSKGGEFESRMLHNTPPSP